MPLFAQQNDDQDRIYFQPTDLRVTPQHHQHADIKEPQPVTAHNHLEDGASTPFKMNDAERGGNGLPDCKTQADYLDFFIDIESILRGQLMQLQTVSSYKLEIERLVKDEPDTCILLAARALDESLTDLKHILHGNVSLIEQVKSMKMVSKNCIDNPSDGLLDTSDEVSELDQDGGSESDSSLTDVDTSSDARGRKLSDQWNISTPGDDPFVDKPSARVVELSHQPCELNYHPDFTQLPGRMLYVPFSKDDDASQMQSCRVILSNLPPDATIAQVLKGVQCYGGLMGVTMLNTKPFCGDKTQSALLEFVYPQSAADYAEAIHSHELFYENKRGAKFQAAAWLIPSPSYTYSYHERQLLDKGQTRAILVKNFPETAVWYFLCAVGVSRVVDVRRVENENGFIFEFTTINQAARVAGLIWIGKFLDIYKATKRGSFSYTIVDDSSQAPHQDFGYEGGYIEHMAPDFLEVEWNREPFNAYWPSEQKPVMRQQGLTPEKPIKPARPTTVERLAKQYDIDVDEVADYLEERENYEDTDFRIIGSDITLTRRKWGWRITKEDETKLLMAMTLHESDWADEWDSHFEIRREVNLRTWEQYGMLAKERRERAEEQGLDEGKIPSGCESLKSAPVPAMVKKYLDVSKVTYLEV
ncbi:hypothetical protein PT974_10037 [Cladobotryum mycophilum]|uniref:RRM domain-containing protein n=1 Tax=Cladobotryum mycophilum TaxID=491253 RepID=A0ABR0S8P7_9HYPO